MECCNRPMLDWSYTRGHSMLNPKVPHFYCTKCSRHEHDGQSYTADEWFFYINGMTCQQYQENLRMENETHLHELVNHSDPEQYP